MNKLVKLAKTSLYFQLVAVLTATSIIYSLSLITVQLDSYFNLAYPLNATPLIVGKYALGFTTLSTFYSIYGFLLWFKDKEIPLDSKIAYSMVISVLFVSSVRFLGYFLPQNTTQQLNKFVLEGVYFFPIILILVSSREVLLENRLDLLNRIGKFSAKWKEILEGWIIIPISSMAALLVEFLILTPNYGKSLFWMSIGPAIIILAIIAGHFVYSMNLENLGDVQELLLEQSRIILSEAEKPKRESK